MGKKTYNLLSKKGLVSVALAGVIIASPFMMTGCSAGQDGKDGLDGAPGTICKSGYDVTEFDDAKVGDFFIDTDDYILYQKTTTDWVVVMENFGKPVAIANDIELQVDSGKIQWRYKTGEDVEWKDLLAVSALVGDDGYTPYIKDGYWYINDQNQNIQATGDDGKEIELNKSSDYIQWKYVGDAEWNNLVALSLLQGPEGDEGKSVKIAVNEGNVQWRFVDDSNEWQTIIAIDSLKGDDGVTPHIDETTKNWFIGTTDTGYKAAGIDGRQIEIQVRSEYIQWKYDNDDTWNNLIALSELKGSDGATWLSGDENPITEGNNGDFYLNEGTYDIFKKVDGIWENIGNIKGESVVGEAGKDGNTWQVGGSDPSSESCNEGDMYLNYLTYDIFTFTDTGWQKIGNISYGGSEASPIIITTANDLLALGATNTYKYYKLACDIDLNELSDIFATRSELIDSFVGQLDGNGYSIIMPNSAYMSYGTIFEKYQGVVKNVNLHFDNVTQEINFCCTSNGTVFENVTTSGQITLPSTTNYAPLTNFVKADTSFVDCVNNLDILGDATYGSAFVGGYMYDNETPDKSILLTDMKLSFIRCKNTGTIIMDCASMLYGNVTRLPKYENLTIEDCENQGSINGKYYAHLFASQLGVWSVDGLYKYYFDYIAEIDSDSNMDITNTQAGVCTVIQELETLTYSGIKDSTYKITRTDDLSAVYSYELSLGVRIMVDENSSSLVNVKWDLQPDSSEATYDTNIGNYKFITPQKYNNMEKEQTIASNELVENCTIYCNSGFSATLYLVTDTDDNKYYYIELESGDNYVMEGAEDYNVSNYSVWTTLTVKNEEGTEIAFIRI